MRQEARQVSGLPTIAGTPMVPSTHLRASVCLVVAGHDAEGEALVARLRGRGRRVLVARTPFEAVVKATVHEPGVILLDPSLGRAAIAETETLLAQCPVTAPLRVVELSPARAVPAELLATPAA
jgi:hypothetical protein